MYKTYDKAIGRWHLYNSHTHGTYYRRGLVARGQSIGRSYCLESVDFRPGDVIVDCGANVGDLYLWLLFTHPLKGLIYVGIEPGRDEFECLLANVDAHDAYLLNLALGSENGTAHFYYEPAGANSSLIAPEHFDEIYSVDVRRLENIWSDLDLAERRIRLLKLEAEGAEPEVLVGLGELLNRVDFVSADLGPERGLRQEPTVTPVANYLFHHGFQMVDSNGLRILFGRS